MAYSDPFSPSVAGVTPLVAKTSAFDVTPAFQKNKTGQFF